MNSKKDKSRDQTEESKSSLSKQDELSDDQLEFSGGVAAVVAACTKCNQSPCVCSTIV